MVFLPMNIFPLILITITAFTHTYWNFILKQSINKGADSAVIYWLSCVMSLILYSFVFLYFIRSYPISSYGIVLTLICGVFLAIYTFLLAKSYEYGDLSQVYPLAKTTPLYTLLIGVFYLKEVVSSFALLGIVLIVIGAYSIHLKNFKLKNILKPIISLRHKASILAMTTAVISSFVGLSSKLGAVEMNPFIFVYLAYFFLVITYIPFLYFKTENTLSQFKRFKKSVIKIGFFDLFTYSLVTLTLSISELSYVFAVRQMSILISVFVGHYILKEKSGETRLVASIIIIFGIILLTIF